VKQAQQNYIVSAYKNTSLQEQNIKELMLEKLMKDEQIKLRWNALIEVDFVEEDADYLLKEIISLLVTMRGFSLAVTWLETYKQSTAKKY